MPDALFLLFDAVVAFDHLRSGCCDDDLDRRTARSRAMARLDRLDGLQACSPRRTPRNPARGSSLRPADPAGSALEAAAVEREGNIARGRGLPGRGLAALDGAARRSIRSTCTARSAP